MKLREKWPQTMSKLPCQHQRQRSRHRAGEIDLDRLEAAHVAAAVDAVGPNVRAAEHPAGGAADPQPDRAVARDCSRDDCEGLAVPAHALKLVVQQVGAVADPLGMGCTRG